YAEAAAGIGWLNVRNPGFAWIGQLGGRHRSNSDASFIDSTLVNGLIGFAWQRRGIYGNASFETYASARDGDQNENFSGLSMMIGAPLGQSSWHLVGDARLGALRFDDDLSVMDVDRVLAGLGLVRRFGQGGSVTLQAITGDDSAERPTSPFGNSKSGMRIAVNALLSPNLSIATSAGSLDSDFDRPFFGLVRNDEQRSVVIELGWRRSNRLTIAPRLRWTDNDSTVALYDYDRSEVGVAIRYTLGR
ncbi:MAG: hypothetical protein R3305_04845, partial [Gammaproteobacteria bacterium]|nr:hypothetical protein [Gammaproteobacteria bacterium]